LLRAHLTNNLLKLLMAITFLPDPRMILMCDFTTGFERHEMQKIRHCVVTSPMRRSGTCVIVPVSKQAPHKIEQWHYKIPQNSYRCMESDTDLWVKGDMITHVAISRLSLPKENHKEVRAYFKGEDMKELLRAVFHAICCGHVADRL
jgi:uncharacterized protein YifN (PemK superfamily)